jgi:hypothetical protein
MLFCLRENSCGIQLICKAHVSSKNVSEMGPEWGMFAELCRAEICAYPNHTFQPAARLSVRLRIKYGPFQCDFHWQCRLFRVLLCGECCETAMGSLYAFKRTRFHKTHIWKTIVKLLLKRHVRAWVYKNGVVCCQTAHSSELRAARRKERKVAVE